MMGRSLVIFVTMVLMAAGRSIQREERIHVTNQLTKTLIAHCRSKDTDMGAQAIGVGSELSWSFEDQVFGGTLFWCNLAVEDKRLHFVAYKDEGRYRDTTHWVVNHNGVYSTDQGYLYPW